MCTVFISGNFAGKSYDNFTRNGMVFTNLRGMKKCSLALPGTEELWWESKYGSVTFSQCGKGMPVNGINECGLIAEQATLPDTIYPDTDARPEISCLEAIQYILDTCSNTEEALNSFNNFRISAMSWTMHYMFIDSAKNTAIVEFIDGEMKVYTGDDIKLPLITNSPYIRSLKGESDPEDDTEYDKNSLKRFMIARKEIADKEADSADEVFKILEKAKRDDTLWRCVYDIPKKKVFFNSIYSQKILEIDLADLDLTEDSKPLLFDLETNDTELTWNEYTRELNRKNIEGFFNNDTVIKMMHLPGSEFMVKTYDNHITRIEENGL